MPCQNDRFFKSFSRLSTVRMVSRYSAAPETLVTDLDTELVLVHGTTGKAWRFNGSARELFLALPADRESLIERLLTVYDVSRAQAAADVDTALAQLVNAGLVLTSEAL